MAPIVDKSTGFTGMTCTYAQVKQQQFCEKAKSLDNAIASLRCTEAQLSGELREISVLLVLTQNVPGRNVPAKCHDVSSAPKLS